MKKAVQLIVGILATLITINGLLILFAHKKDGILHQISFSKEYVFNKFFLRVIFEFAWITLAAYCFGFIPKKYPIVLFILWILYMSIVIIIFKPDLYKEL
jgi:hypothetical protein